MNIGLLLSGGTGTRLGVEIPKQYICVNGKMIITYALKTLLEHPQIDKVLIVAEVEWRKQILADIRKWKIDADKEIVFAVPGITRQFSVLNALDRIAEMDTQMLYIQKDDEAKENWKVKNILIHDAARPNLTADMVSHCMETLKEHEGVMPVLSMKDTVYSSENGTTISKLLDRNQLYAGQAPEGFRFEPYYEANRRLMPEELHRINGASEPAVLAGMDVVMIPGDENNYKITTKKDLERFLLEYNYEK